MKVSRTSLVKKRGREVCALRSASTEAQGCGEECIPGSVRAPCSGSGGVVLGGRLRLSSERP